MRPPSSRYARAARPAAGPPSSRPPRALLPLLSRHHPATPLPLTAPAGSSLLLHTSAVRPVHWFWRINGIFSRQRRIGQLPPPTSSSTKSLLAPPPAPHTAPPKHSSPRGVSRSSYRFLRTPLAFSKSAMSVNSYVDANDAYDFDQPPPAASSAPPPPPPSRNSTSTPAQPARSSLSSWKSRAESAVNSFATKHANASFSRQISRIISAGNAAQRDPIAGPPAQYSEPSDDESLLIYPSYCHLSDSGTYELDVRGCITLPPLQNNRTRIVMSTARKIAGVKPQPASSSSSNFSFYESPGPSPSSSSASLNVDPDDSSSAASVDYTKLSSSHQLSDPLDVRMRPFLSRSVPGREVELEIFSASGQVSNDHSVVTDASGRFSTRVSLEFQPVYIRVTAGLKNTEVDVNFVEPHGFSVISDIDDTIKITGILGGKREIFRNVFVYDYKKIEIPGILQCYQDLHALGANFHYVSNSPWQLFPTISEFTKSAGFPQGSFHLKLYNGLIGGIFEAAHEKKKQNLHKIFRDFPHRRFLLVGDSGEGDLEAYTDVAHSFPNQVIGIMIRDITLPEDDTSHIAGRDRDVDLFKRNYVPRPDEIDRYDSSIPRSSRFHRQQRESSSAGEDAPPPLPPRPGAASNTPTPPPPPPSRPTPSPPPLIDLGDSTEPAPIQAAPTQAAPATPHRIPRKPPKIPPKPSNLRQAHPEASPSTPLPTAPPALPKRDGNLVINSQSRGIIDSSNLPPPPPLPRNTRTPEPAPTPTSTHSSSSSSLTQTSLYRQQRRESGNPVVLASSQDEFYDLLDKRIESWKARVHSARSHLPTGVVLRMWRVGDDMAAECKELLMREKQNLG